MGIFSKLFSGKKKNEHNLIKDSDVYFKAGEAYFKKNDYLNSKKFFEKALEIFPDHKKAIRNLDVVNNKLKIINSNREKDKLHNEGLSQDEKNLSTSKESSNFGSLDQIDSTNKANDNEINYYYNFFDIPRNITNDEIKEILAKEFRNWRTKINSPDPKKKYKAEEMLNKIAKARKILLK